MELCAQEGRSLTPTEKALMLYGDAWLWTAFVPEWRLVLAFLVGKRVQENVDVLIERLKAVSCGFIPFFTADQLPRYPQALLNAYGVPEVMVHIPGKRGPKPKPKPLPPPDLHYAQVVKRRRRGRVVQVTTKVIFGSEEAIQARLVAPLVSETINIGFVERNNLTFRQCNGRLSRKVLSFSKDLTWMEKHLWLNLAYYHFVLPHGSLAQPLPSHNQLLAPAHPRSGSPSRQPWRPVSRITSGQWKSCLAIVSHLTSGTLLNNEPLSTTNISIHAIQGHHPKFVV